MKKSKSENGSDLFAGRASVEAMLDVRTVADLLDCSARHVYRLADAGRMPRPIKLGKLVRWRRSAVEAWLADDCPLVRKGVR